MHDGIDEESVSWADDSDESYVHTFKKFKKAAPKKPKEVVVADSDEYDFEILEFLHPPPTHLHVTPGMKMALDTATNVTAIEWRLWPASPIAYSDGLVLEHDTWFLEVQHNSGEFEYISDTDIYWKAARLFPALVTNQPSASPTVPQVQKLSSFLPASPLIQPLVLHSIDDPRQNWQFSLDDAMELQCELNGDGWHPTRIDLVDKSCRVAIRVQLAGMGMTGRRLDTTCASTLNDIKASPSDYLHEECAICKTLARAYTARWTDTSIDKNEATIISLPLGRVVEDETDAMFSGIRSNVTDVAHGINLPTFASQVVYDVVRMPLSRNHVGHKMTCEKGLNHSALQRMLRTYNIRVLDNYISVYCPILYSEGVKECMTVVTLAGERLGVFGQLDVSEQGVTNFITERQDPDSYFAHPDNEIIKSREYGM